MRRLIDALRRAFAQTVIIERRVSSRPMSKADWEHFDASFKKMNEAFDELRKIGS